MSRHPAGHLPCIPAEEFGTDGRGCGTGGWRRSVGGMDDYGGLKAPVCPRSGLRVHTAADVLVHHGLGLSQAAAMLALAGPDGRHLLQGIGGEGAPVDLCGLWRKAMPRASLLHRTHLPARHDGKGKVHGRQPARSEEHTSELQSHSDLVCRLLLEKKKKTTVQSDEDSTHVSNQSDTTEIYDL